MDSTDTIYDLKRLVSEFYEERKWSKLYNAKDLSIAISTESNELLDLFLFESCNEIDRMLKSTKLREKIGSQLADVFYFTLAFSHKYKFDLSVELRKKIILNAKRYTRRNSKNIDK